MTVISHVGSTLVSLLYLAPMVIVVAMLAVSNFRDRRRGDDDEPANPDDDEAASTGEATNPDEGHEP